MDRTDEAILDIMKGNARISYWYLREVISINAKHSVLEKDHEKQ